MTAPLDREAVRRTLNEPEQGNVVFATLSARDANAVADLLRHALDALAERDALREFRDTAREYSRQLWDEREAFRRERDALQAENERLRARLSVAERIIKDEARLWSHYEAQVTWPAALDTQTADDGEAVPETPEERDERFRGGNDATWGAGNWIKCSTCPPDHFGKPVYHHKSAHDGEAAPSDDRQGPLRADGVTHRVPSEPLVRPGDADQMVLAGALIRDDHGRYLLLHRNTPTMRWWEVPGGKVELGENHWEAARRELAEELNASVEPVVKVGTGKFDHQGQVLRYTWYVARVVAGEPSVVEKDRFDEARYFTLAEVERIPEPSPSLRKLLELYGGRLKDIAEASTRLGEAPHLGTAEASTTNLMPKAHDGAPWLNPRGVR